MSFKWRQIEIQTPHGFEKAIAPIIISASRSTDIPAFYGEWFMNRLKAGYIKWNNPFNINKPQYVSLRDARVIVFWTKDAAPFEKYLEEIDSIGINYYFSLTLNDYEQEKYEPNIPPLQERINTFKRLSNKIGKDRVIWRFDPLIVTDKLGIKQLLERIKAIGDELAPYTKKLVFSFADIEVYKKVERNMTAHDSSWKSFTKNDMYDFAEGLVKLNKEWQLELATCCEEVDFSKVGIMHNSCIDGDLMLRLFAKDYKLRDFLIPGHNTGTESIPLFETQNNSEKIEINKLKKDPGQRKICGCIVSKDIGQYNTCPHHCVYCYANFSRDIVNANISLVDNKSESIIP